MYFYYTQVIQFLPEYRVPKNEIRRSGGGGVKCACGGPEQGQFATGSSGSMPPTPQHQRQHADNFL